MHPTPTPTHSSPARVVILVSDTSFHVHNILVIPIANLYQISLKYSQGYSNYRTDTKSLQNRLFKYARPNLSFIYRTPHRNLLFCRVFVLQSRDKKSNSNTSRGDNSKSKKKPKLSFLYVTCPLVLFFITTKYHQNVPKSV